MSKSKSPIGCPSLRSSAFNSPKRLTAESVRGKTGSCSIKNSARAKFSSTRLELNAPKYSSAAVIMQMEM